MSTVTDISTAVNFDTALRTLAAAPMLPRDHSYCSAQSISGSTSSIPSPEAMAQPSR
jgi:hypothetical protein